VLWDRKNYQFPLQGCALLSRISGFLSPALPRARASHRSQPFPNGRVIVRSYYAYRLCPRSRFHWFALALSFIALVIFVPAAASHRFKNTVF
jgi:hypothetical protein